MNIFSVPNIDQVQRAMKKAKQEQRMKALLLRALRSGKVNINIATNRTITFPDSRVNKKLNNSKEG